jgi:hypothetical protein
VPKSFQPVRSPRLARSAAAAVVTLVVLGVVYLVAIKHVPLIPQPTSCTAVADRQALPLTVGQAGIAATIAGVAARRDLPVRAVAIAYATALQEAKLSNPNYGDRDSVGVFQQRPSQGWGTKQEIENPVYASGRFFAALTAVPHYLKLPVYEAAQAVQRSADGAAYGQYATVGAQLADAFYGGARHAFSCYYAGSVGKPRLSAADQALTGAFGDLHRQVAGDPAIAVRPRRPAEGWAVAAWLISHASSYGINYVRYSGFEWHARKDSGRWGRARAPVQAQAAPASVVFG